ncbi:hypothetical protein [Streptomyces rhizosphaerihabitans]|uniref:hypothetical protein n=1 Tax=Streptomyces rhizosphaerihabitans TaxID=1266770 RepID=UPI0021BFB4F3|nr:hypothetical protein [Streptomyces rhizosphaerihabitans]MCT9010310.1 hypothetical protein [Streptomyces rhizosphaerihabitans]
MTTSAPLSRITQPLSPFGQQPRRWEKKRVRAVRGSHACTGCAAGCEPVLIREQTGWGWIDWNVPVDGSLPEQPHRIAVFTPIATRMQRLCLRWLARSSAHRIRLDPVAVRTTTAAVAALALPAAVLAILHGVPFAIVLLAAALAPLLVEHSSNPLKARAGENVWIVEAEAACRYLQRLAALHAGLVRAAAGSDRHEVRRAVEIGHHQLFDTADLLQRHDTRSASGELIAREQLMLQLAVQIRHIVTPAQGGAPSVRHDRADVPQPLGPYPPRPRHSSGHSTPIASMKEETYMPQDGPEEPARQVYLLFAHEAYYPAAAREINTSLVAAASLLHPRVRQPDGARIYDRLVRGRRQGEIVPLSTLTHELDGGARWPEVGDWEAVTADLLQLIQDRACDVLSLDLPHVARALVCSGPHSRVRAYDPAAGRYQTWGPADRIQVLVEVGRQLAVAEAARALWPGAGLLLPTHPGDDK